MMQQNRQLAKPVFPPSLFERDDPSPIKVRDVVNSDFQEKNKIDEENEDEQDKQGQDEDEDESEEDEADQDSPNDDEGINNDEAS